MSSVEIAEITSNHPNAMKNLNFFQSLEKTRAKLMENGRQKIDSIQSHFSFPRSGNPVPDPNETDLTFTILYLIGLFLLALLIVFIQAFFVKILWNFVIPPVFGLEKVNRLTWLSAVSLLVLVRILFF